VHEHVAGTEGTIAQGPEVPVLVVPVELEELVVLEEVEVELEVVDPLVDPVEVVELEELVWGMQPMNGKLLIWTDPLQFFPKTCPLTAPQLLAVPMLISANGARTVPWTEPWAKLVA